MIRKLLGCASAAAVVVGMTAVAPIAVAGPAAALPNFICDFLDDGSGAGSAASLAPGYLADGEQFRQVNTGAWQVCYDTDGGQISMLSAPTWCMADDNGRVLLHLCRVGDNAQVWSGAVETQYGSFQLKNKNGGYLCAQGGVGYSDTATSLSICGSDYRDTWEFKDTP